MNYHRDLKVRVISDDEVWFYVVEPGHVERCVAKRSGDVTFYPVDLRGDGILPQGSVTLAIARELERATP